MQGRLMVALVTGVWTCGGRRPASWKQEGWPSRTMSDNHVSQMLGIRTLESNHKFTKQLTKWK